ncbi:hypothetical protein Tco_0913492 [Tanacetum coccineum]
MILEKSGVWSLEMVVDQWWFVVVAWRCRGVFGSLDPRILTTPSSSQMKKKVHKGVNIKANVIVTKKQKRVDKEKGKVNEDEEVLIHKKKVVVANYKRSFDNGREIISGCKQKRQVQPSLNGIMIRDGGLMKVQEDVGDVNKKEHVL